MNKKILVFSILAVVMLVAISMATAVSNEKALEKKESPLFGIRTSRAISEKIQNIKTKFFLNRIFFVQLRLANDNSNLRDRLQEKTESDSGGLTCYDTCDGGSPMTSCCRTQDYHDETCNPNFCTVRRTVFCGTCTQGIFCNN